MRIIHVHPSAAMASKFVLPIMEEEQLLGYNPKLIVFKNDYKNKLSIHFDLRVNNLGLFIEAFKFLLFLRRHKPDIIICHNSLQATVPLLLSKILKIKTRVYFNHGITFLGYKGILKTLFYFFEYLNCHLSNKIITVSSDMKKHLDLIKPNTILINNGSACGIDLQKQYIKNKVNRKKKVVITFVGRLEIRKGINVLIKILDFFETHQNIKFIFCGFTNNEFLKFSKKPYKILQCLGFTDAIDEVLTTSDIALLPSFHEGMPYSILEAMHHKNLVIANNAPGINSLIVDGFNGILVKNNDPKKYIFEINQ